MTYLLKFSFNILRKVKGWAALWLSGLAPPSAQGVILETWDRVPCQAPCM